jgi:hypothetical protein
MTHIVVKSCAKRKVLLEDGYMSSAFNFGNERQTARRNSKLAKTTCGNV